MGKRRDAGWRRAGLLVICVLCIGSFAWGYQSHRARWFPHTLVSAWLPDTDAKDYSWVRPTSRPMADLRGLAYIGATFDPNADRVGVQLHDETRAWQGLNFYYSGFSAPFLLVDMEGHEVWRWEDDTESLVAHAELLPDGDLIVVRFDRAVARLDRNAEERWVAEVRAHHDVWVAAGELFVLSRREALHPEVHPTQPTLEDTVTVLDVDTGEVLRDFSLLEAVRESPYAFLLPSVRHREYAPDDGPLDVIHSNHVEVFDGSLADRDPLFAAGNVLVSMRHLNAIMILDGESLDVLWVWGPSNTYGQHHPRLLESGRILLFDNGISRSRVLEIEPRTGAVVWDYDADDLFTALRGSVQRLPNGNTLITESDTGYVLEVTPAGTTVWEFANPDVTAGGDRSIIWRMTRHETTALTFTSGDVR